MGLGYEKAKDSDSHDELTDNWRRTFGKVPMVDGLDHVSNLVHAGETTEAIVRLMGKGLNAYDAEFVVREIARGNLG